VEKFQRYTTAREITSRLRYDRAETKTIELNMNKSVKRHPARIARIRRRWRSLSFQVRLTLIVTVLLGIVAAVPSYIGLLATRSREGSSSAAPPGSAHGAGPPGTTNTSLRQPSGQAAGLRLDAAYIRTPESIMWAVPRTLPPEDDPVILGPNLIGNEPAQGRISALLLERGGVKIEADETEDFRPHSQIRLVITGQHERPVLVTGLRANVVRRERPLSQTLVYGPPQGAGENIQVGSGP